MSSQTRLAHARAITERPRSIKFVDPFNSGQPIPSTANRPNAAARSVPAPILVRRNNTTGSSRRISPRQQQQQQRQPEGETVDVQQRPLVGRAPPIAQFNIVTPPRSPTDTNTQAITNTSTTLQRKESRLPLRFKSTTQAQDPSRRSAPTITDPSRRNSQNPNSSLIPVRKPVAGWAESHQSFAALKPSSRRGALPRAWVDGTPRREFGAGPGPGGMHRRDTMPPRVSQPVVDMEYQHPRAKSDPDIKPGMPEYPQLSSDERNVLVQKLRMLLKCIDADSRALNEWEASSEDIGTRSSGCVFGTSVKDSIAYASCKVVLGEHGHSLPICVFAAVEEICQRGITTPALFRIAPSPNERTLEKLTHKFNQRPGYGAGHSLANQDISNVCALLKLYLRGLPEPVFSPALWPLLQQITLTPATDPLHALESRIAAVQAAFHLQHHTSFSLLVYVLAFLHQLVLHGHLNGLNVSTLAGMFGPALFAPRKEGTVGVVMSPKPDAPVLVKTFRSARDKAEGARVLGWILEHWDQIATGLLSLDIARDGEDVAEWAARFVVGARRPSSEGSGSESETETVYGEGPAVDKVLGLETEKLVAFPFPEILSVDQVKVRHVRDSIVEIVEVPPAQSTRASSPATVWSQDTASQKDTMSRTGSIQYEHIPPNAEPAYVADLRHRMAAQEAELVALRRELNSIRDRFVFPLPPFEAAADVEVDEDMMPTPRPSSGPHCVEPAPTMRDLVESLQSEPPTPLFHRVLQKSMFDAETSTLSSDEHEEILSADVFSDLGPSTPPSDELSGRSFFVANPDSDSSEDEGSTRGSIKGKLDELYTARDALRSALAAMAPVEVQLRAVEEELQLRGRESGR